MTDAFEAPVRDGAPAKPDMLQVDVNGYAGPLDMLLDLAQRQKLDLVKVSVKPIAEQFLAHIEAARALRIEVAADMLVMAAWLTYLKAKLLVPDDPEEEAEAEELAEHLAFRLRRLEAMRTAAAALFARPQLGEHVFFRGHSDAPPPTTDIAYVGNLYSLLAAYGTVRQADIVRHTTMAKSPMFSLVDARAVMERVLGRHAGWLPLDALITHMPAGRRAALAASFGATLELAREGQLDVRQSGPFAPIELRAIKDAAP